MPKAPSPRHEVISVRLNQDRFELLGRFQQTLTEQLGREVSLAEAAFVALEDRAASMDRTATRHELLLAPTESLGRIRKQWGSHHALSAAEWDVVAEYVKVATEHERQDPQVLAPAVPSRESYLALVDAFEAVYQHRAQQISQHTWAYFGNLGGFLTPVQLFDADPDQRHQAVMARIADCRAQLRPTDTWVRPHNIGHCFSLAVREEGVDSTTLDYVLAPHWPTLWGLAARGHWIRHDHRPVRVMMAADDARRHIMLPASVTADNLTLSFLSLGGPEFTTSVEFAGCHVGLVISHYPELVEFRALLEAPPDGVWTGKYFHAATNSEGRTTAGRSLWLKPREVRLDLSAHEWTTLRDLVRQAWKSSDLQRWLLELQQEYGEHG